MDFERDREAAARALYGMAKEAAKKAYAPYSKFQVGAALLTGSGGIYTGVNVENASYGAAICAERTAFVKAISEGERSFVAMAVAAEQSEALPCGICRQFMNEFAPELEIITGEDESSLHIRKLCELLPLAFTLRQEQEDPAATEG